MKVRIAIALLALATACSDEPLEDDANGAKACRKLIESIEAGDDIDAANEAIVAAINAAVKSKTEDIRTAPDPEDLTPRRLDITQLRDACQANGFDIPDA